LAAVSVVFQEDKHMLMFYDDEQQRDREILRFINEGLEAGDLCIYGTIYTRDEDYFQSLCSRIIDYEENVKKGNLLVVDFTPFYIAAMSCDLAPYEKVQNQLESMFRDRKDLRVRYIGDATGFLFKNKHFDECVMVEHWWQTNRIKEVTTLCVFEKSLLDKYPFNYQLQRVLENHDVAIDASGCACTAQVGKTQRGEDADGND
jgi:KaiC/GvpD/RAD55 family RecA-like ATPase